MTFLRTIGDALRDKVGEPDVSSRERVGRPSALVPYDDILVGRAEAEGQIIWMRPTDEHDHDDLRQLCRSTTPRGVSKVGDPTSPLIVPLSAR